MLLPHNVLMRSCHSQKLCAAYAKLTSKEESEDEDEDIHFDPADLFADLGDLFGGPAGMAAFMFM